MNIYKHAKNPNFDIHQCGFASIFFKCFDKKSRDNSYTETTIAFDAVSNTAPKN